MFYFLYVLKFLKEGFFTEEYLSDGIPKLMNCICDCNMTLRWVMLHTSEGGWSSFFAITIYDCKVAIFIKKMV